MPPTRPPYPAELKCQIIELVRAGRSPSELAREFEPTAQTIQNWIRQADRDEGLRADGLTSDEREELRRLRRENKQLRIEREILSKAAAWFAAETDAIPKNLRVRESAPGTLANRHAMPSPKCFPQWVLCLASTSTL